MSKQTKTLIAIGNPIVDISAETDSATIEKYKLEWGRTVFANDENRGIFEELEKKPDVSYVPGGSIQNSLRVACWCLGMQNDTQDYKLSMLGCVGNDLYKDKITTALKEAGVTPLLQANNEMNSSRCGVAIYEKERCLVPEIKASNTLSEAFVNENIETICNNDILLVEGYFIVERFEIVKNLVKKFKEANKLVIFTLSAVFLLQAHYDKVIEIANQSDFVFCNIEEAEALAVEKGETPQDTIARAHKKLAPNNARLLVVTAGSRGVIGSKYDFERDQLDFVIQSFPKFIKNEEIVDTNGAGDAFLGGFLAQWMQGRSIEVCCKAGNTASGVILKNVGCTFPIDMKIDFTA
jgi:adenosine kinase